MSSQDRAAIAIGLGCVVTSLALAFFWQKPVSDFSNLYSSGLAWRTGSGNPFQIPGYHANLNTPVVVALVFAPLSFFPPVHAKAAWIILSLAALFSSVLVIAASSGRSRAVVVYALGLCLVAAAAWYAWVLGQTTWIVLYPMTCAWAAYRRGRRTAAVWLAVAILMKPFLVIAALVLPWRLWLAAGVLAGAGAAASMATSGWAPWALWFAGVSSVDWLANPWNASLWGVAKRLDAVPVGGVRTVSLFAVVLILVTTGAMARRVVREADPDRRTLMALILALLASPLGWVYYVPWALGPAAAAKSLNSRWVLLAVVGFCVPLPLLEPHWEGSRVWTSLVGACYTSALMCGWIACTGVPRSATDLLATEDDGEAPGRTGTADPC